MPRPRKRFSMRRFLLMVLALAVLFLLLKMNAWFPGGWPGGGGGGFRAVPEGGVPDPRHVRPAEEPVEWPPSDGVRIEVRAAEGAPVREWAVGAGPEGAGRVDREPERLIDAAAFRDGFRVRKGDWDLRHGAGPKVRTDAWVVYVPDGQPPSTSAEPEKAPPPVRTKIVDPTSGAPLPAATVRLVRDGSATPVPVAKDGTFELALGAPERAGAHLEVRVEGRPVAIVRADAVAEALPVPEGRVVEVKVTDPDRRRPPGATVTARYATSVAPGGAEPIEASATVEAGDDGSARIPVPATGAVDLLAEGLDRAPAVRRISAVDAGAPVEMVLERGLSVPVRVLASDGSPAAGAEVIAVAATGGVRVERRALGSAEGRANVGPVAAGPVEIYAKAPGHTWTAATASATSAMGTTEIRLTPGSPLTLVVETAEGKPVAGARVRLSSEEGGAPDVTPPGVTGYATDAKGVLVAPDLPVHAFTVHVSAPGYRTARLGRVRPGPTTYFATLVRE